MKKMTIRLTDEQTALIELTAKREGRSKSSIVREIVEEYFALHRNAQLLSETQPVTRKRPRSIGAFPSDTVHGRNFDEWMAANRERDW